MTTITNMSLNSLVFFLGILIIISAATDDLVLPDLTLLQVQQDGPNDFLPQRPQVNLSNYTASADVFQNENSKTHDIKEEQDNDNVEQVNDSYRPYGERDGLPHLPVPIVNSNLTSQPVDSVVTTSENPQEQEDTELSNKDISNSEVIMGEKSGQPKNSVSIDNEDEGQLGQNNETTISDSNSTLIDFHGKNVTANYSQWSQEDNLPVLPSYALHLDDHTENVKLERFIHNETVDITSAEIDNTSASIKESDLLQPEGMNASSSSNQSDQEHVHRGSQYSLQYLLQQQQRLLSAQFQPQKHSYNSTDIALLPESHSQLGSQQNAHTEHAELPLPPTYNTELPVGKEGLSQQYHPQQQHHEQEGQLLELPRLPVYKDSPKEQQQEEQKEQPIELPLHKYSPKYQQQIQPLELSKPPLYQYGRKEQQQPQQQHQPLELPTPPLYQYGQKEQQQPQQQHQPLELPTPPLYQFVTKDQQQQQPIELPKPPLYGQKEEQQQHQQEQLLELPTPPLYQNGPKEYKQQIPQQQPLPLPKAPLYQYDPKKQQQLIQQLQQQLLEQQQKLDSLELLKPPQYQYGTKEEKQQQPLDLPALPLYPNGVKEHQKLPLELPALPLYPNGMKEQQQQQPLELPALPLYPNGVKEQQQQQPIEFPKLPVYQYDLQQNQKKQPLELPKLTTHKVTQHVQTPQPEENKYVQAGLSQPPKEVAKLAGDMQKLPEHSPANGTTSNDEGDSTGYSETAGSMISSNENENQSNYEPPVSPLGKQADTDYKQKTKWKSVYKVNNKGQDEWYKEVTHDEGYYGEDDKGGEELKNSHWEGDQADSDDGYANQESTYGDEEELDDGKKTTAGGDDSDTLWDVDNNENGDQDDFNSDKIQLVEDVVDEDLASRSRLPTAPTSMVVFYTWMIVAILIFVVGISMYQSHCHGFRFRLPGSKPSSSGSDRKRLLDHEFV